MTRLRSAPDSPPRRPRGACFIRLFTALSGQGRSVSTLNSMTWPSPPSADPPPPDPGRSPLRRNRTGADASTPSSATAATPVGYDVALTPALLARAPPPPAQVDIAGLQGQPSSCAQLSCNLPTHPHPAPSTHPRPH